ncbi:ABC transporter permease [soil metagenome]
MSSAAPAVARIRAHVGFEVAALLRNGEQLLVSMVLPLLALLTLTWAAPGALLTGTESNQGDVIASVVPGVLALAVVSTAFTGQAIALGYERRYGVLRLLGTTPVGRSGLLIAKAVAVLVVVAIQAVVVAGAGVALGWQVPWAALPAAIVLLVLAVATFGAAAALLGGSLRAEAVLAFANLLWVLFLGALLLPLAALPPDLGTAVGYTPPGALGEGLRAALVHGEGLGLQYAAVLIAWCLALSAIAARTWQWSD